LFAIRLGLEVLVPESAGCNDDSYNTQTPCHIERPLSALDTCDGIGLTQRPTCAVRIGTTNVEMRSCGSKRLLLLIHLTSTLSVMALLLNCPSREPAGSLQSCRAVVSQARTARLALAGSLYAERGSFPFVSSAMAAASRAPARTVARRSSASSPLPRC